MNYSIRPINKMDFSFMQKLTNESMVNRYSNKIGFVEFPLNSITNYNYRLSLAAYSYILSVHDEPVGFITGFDSLTMKANSFHNEIISHISDDLNYVYFEQLAVLLSKRNKGFGNFLVEYALAVSLQNNFDSAFFIASHTPLEHKVSMRFASKYDFDLKTIFDIDAMCFGLYEKRLIK